MHPRSHSAGFAQDRITWGTNVRRACQRFVGEKEETKREPEPGSSSHTRLSGAQRAEPLPVLCSRTTTPEETEKPSIEKREARGALLSLLLSTWKNTKYREARSERGSLISSSFDLEKYQVSRKREARGALVSLLLSTLFFNSIDLSSPSWLPYVWRE